MDTLLLPALDQQTSSGLVGIARLAAQGEHLRDGHEVEFFSLESRSILNRCDVPRMPFNWTINPYRGCEFACKYCYARYTHEFMELGELDFEQKIYVKQNVDWLLRRDLKKVKPGEEIAIGTATDPYQPAEKKFEATRAILSEFSRHRGFDLGIVTKSNLILRDLDVLKRVAENNSLFVNITITTLDTHLARILEPRAPRPDLRLDAVRLLNAAGIDAGVICAPVVPGVTDSPAALDALVHATKEAGGKYIFANPLFLKPCSATVFLPFLEKEFPHLVSEYRQRFESKAFMPETYRKRISELMRKLRAKYGIRHDFSAKSVSTHGNQPSQLALFAESPSKPATSASQFSGAHAQPSLERRKQTMC
jgi:DNA repair photolyase